MAKIAGWQLPPATQRAGGRRGGAWELRATSYLTCSQETSNTQPSWVWERSANFCRSPSWRLRAVPQRTCVRFQRIVSRHKHSCHRCASCKHVELSSTRALVCPLRVCCFLSAAPAEPVGPESDRNFYAYEVSIVIPHGWLTRFASDLHPLLEGV